MISYNVAWQGTTRLVHSCRWLRNLVPWIEKVASAMHRLLLNHREPIEKVHLLLGGVVKSVCMSKIYSVRQQVAIWVVRGYRTLFFEATTISVSTPALTPPNLIFLTISYYNKV